MIQVRLRNHFPARPDSTPFTLDAAFQTSAGVTALFGPSGAGKTVTLDCIAGFIRPAEGRVVMGETVLFDAAAGVNLPPRARQCGYVFQNYALFPHRTLRENLEFAAERLPSLERRRRVNAILESFRLEEVAGRHPHELSGGQKQRCSIARALLAAPRLLLLDEPAQGLDHALRLDLYGALRQVRADFSTPILLVTHDLDECFELAGEMLILDRGRVLQSGSPRTILDNPASIDVARLLGRYNLLPVQIKALDPARDSSLLRFGEFDLAGPYFRGRFIGDNVTLFIRPEQLTARPRDGRPGPNQVPATLERAGDRPESVRLEFSNGIVVTAPRADFERNRHNKEWVVEFPAPWLRVL